MARFAICFRRYGNCALFVQAVLSKIRHRFGGNLKVSFVGGAATSMEVLNFFENINIKILEGYGLTETSPLVTVNTPEQVEYYERI